MPQEKHDTYIKGTLNNVCQNILECNNGQKVWAVGDVHGCYDQFMGIIKSPLIGNNDIVILIGDIIDRGPDSIKMLEWAMENVNNGGKYYMIRGNHEQNIIDEYNKFAEKNTKKNQYRVQEGIAPADYLEYSIYDLRCNYDFCEYMERAGIIKVGQALKYIEWMKTLPLYMWVTIPDGRKYILAHAWFEGKILDDGSIRPCISDEDILWYRDTDIYDNISRPDYSPMAGETLIHGHTPIPVIDGRGAKLAEPIFREHSINIDGGCFIGRQYGGRLIALCLNDLQAFYTSRN